MKKLILIQLNELNFDLIKKYPKKFKNFNYLIENGLFKNTSEQKYELLEPWIQWTSVHTGLRAKSHRVKHLDDIKNCKSKQIFEVIESKGFSVGAISPMNTLNKLKRPLYFIPDPWTKTNPDKSYLSNRIHSVLKETVKNNANFKLSFKLIFQIFYIFLKVVRIKKYFQFIKLVSEAINKKWLRAIFLDFLLNEVNIYYIKKFKPNFATIFFNGGAHIQHHYLLKTKKKDYLPNWYVSKHDNPIKDLAIYYNQLLKDLYSIKEYKIILATGLSQKTIEKPIFYWKLRKYSNFLNIFKIYHKNIRQLMSRDFVIYFENKKQLNEAYKKLFRLKIHNITNRKKIKAFKILKRRFIDNSIFVSLTFDQNLTENHYFSLNKVNVLAKDFTDFVAIKNGIHSPLGFLFANTKKFSFKKSLYVNKIFNIINNFFNK